MTALVRFIRQGKSESRDKSESIPGGDKIETNNFSSLTNCSEMMEKVF